mgnify:CR=1 FL=1
MLTATIEHNDGPQAGRVTLKLIREQDRFTWYASCPGVDEYRTDVTGDTEADAILSALNAWSEPWDFRLS